MKKKKVRDSRMLSFAFNTMIDHIKTLNEENKGEMQNGNRREDRSSRNSNEDIKTRNDSSSPGKPSVRKGSLFDSGSVGIESTRTPTKTGEPGDDSSTYDFVRPNENGTERLGQRGSLSNEDGFRDDRHRDSTSVGNRTEPNTPKINAKNYTIKPIDYLGSGGVAVKFADNIKALKLLKTLEADGRQDATEEEQEILVRYVGWGGMPQAFDPNNKNWQARFQELRSLLDTDEAYTQAKRSTQDAHFTSETVITGIYSVLEQFGVHKKQENLRILEPSAGIGNFIGLSPIKADFVAIEQDITTSNIAKYLYPNSHHITKGFQYTKIQDEYFDLVVGNPPFGQQTITDLEHPELKFSIHNYFLAKSISKLREGGIAAFVISRYFMDAQDNSARKHIAEQADFLGAIRLPQSAFQENALTDVTTDIVFFQKKSNQNTNESQEWLDIDTIEVPDRTNYNDDAEAQINKYFINNPDNIAGTMRYVSSPYGKKLTCTPNENINIETQITAIKSSLPVNIFSQETARFQEPTKTTISEAVLASTYFKNLKQDAFFLDPTTNKVVFKCSGNFGVDSYKNAPLRHKNDHARLIAMIDVRDALRSLLNAEKKDAPLEFLNRLRYELNAHYDAFIEKHGYINSQSNRSLIRDDPESALIESLETHYDKGLSAKAAKEQNKEPRQASAQKAKIFSQRVLGVKSVISVKSAKDALVVSLRETGRVNLARMEELLNIPQNVIQQELQEQNLIFHNPVGTWEIRDKYLTGNVREKLAVAEQYAEDSPQYAQNVAALSAVIPADIDAFDIAIALGSTWVPADIFNEFIEEIHEGRGWQTISYLPGAGKFDVDISIYDETISQSVWGIPEYPASKLLTSLLKNAPITVKVPSKDKVDKKGNPVMVVDQALTTAALQKAEQLQEKFVDWVWEDETRRTNLSRLYNDRFNTHVPSSYDGSELELINASPNIHLRPHQKDVIWRSIQEGTALFDHRVGAGKTLACVATVMESKRMGLMRKPMIVVPNSLVYQWRDEFFSLYPDANLLVAEKRDFEPENRERFFGRVTTGEWDAVIVPHSSFKKIDMPFETQKEILQEQIDAVIYALGAIRTKDDNKKYSVKQLEKRRESMIARYEKLIAANGEKIQAVDFSDLGVDALVIDESHEFKNLGFVTTMNVSGLGNVAGSAKALDLFIKTRYIQKKNDGQGVFFLTGTPISNSIAEVYTVQRYLQYDELVKKEIEHFDAWASTYGKISSSWELDSTGVNYKLKDRFANFKNVPELLGMYRSFADVITKTDLDAQSARAGLKPLTPAMKTGAPISVIAPRSPMQAAYMERIIHRMENLPKDPSQDNPLKITNDARKAGLDFRLIDPLAPDFAESKINKAITNIHDIWLDTHADKGTQLIFCDLSTPKKKKYTEVKLDNEKTEKDEDDAVLEMDELMAKNDANKFSVYDDIKEKLIKKGIPASEIAFIHDANTDIRKAKLFADVQNGEVRVLLGSTFKMGTGMNVQERLVALHHLDAPWRPSDIEQRNGRILRQGNKLYERDPKFEVEIYCYATERTYDARMWQIIEKKAAAIEQFRKGDLLQRVIEDVASEASNAAEMKAAASGNPLILIEVQLSSEIRKLETLSVQHKRESFRVKTRKNELGQAAIRFQASKESFEANILLANKTSNRSGIFTKTGNFINKENVNQIIPFFEKGMKNIYNVQNDTFICKYRGFDISVTPSIMGGGKVCFSLKGEGQQKYYPKNITYGISETFSLNGCFQRLDNFLETGIEEEFRKREDTYNKEMKELENIKNSSENGFPKNKELLLAKENHYEVISELNKMREDSEYISTWKPATSLKNEIETLLPQKSKTQAVMEALQEISLKKEIETLPQKSKLKTVRDAIVTQALEDINRLPQEQFHKQSKPYFVSKRSR